MATLGNLYGVSVDHYIRINFAGFISVVDALGGLPAHKLHCSVLAEESIKSAIKDYYDRHGIEYDHSKFPEDCGSCESCRMV